MNTINIVWMYLFLHRFVNFVFDQSQASHRVIGASDRILYGHSFLNITGLTMDACLARCLLECKCLSFQICEDDKMCQLCSSRREQSEESFKFKTGCTSYVFERERLQSESCVQDANCCLTSKPCQNGASCVFHNPRSSIREKARFSCKCKSGYQGVYCEQPIRSCRGYVHNNGNGKYQVIDKMTNTAFPVFCVFWANVRIAWTRVQAYQDHTRDIIEQSFRNDTPVNENAPYQYPFRLSFSRMMSIRQNSSRWLIERKHLHNDCIDVETVQLFELQCSSSCFAITYKRGKNSSTFTRDCYVTHHGNSGCFDDYMAGVDNYGSFCCLSSSHMCSSNSTTTSIWLGDSY